MKRTLKGKYKLLASIIAISFSIFELWVNSFGIMLDIKRNALHLGFLLMLAFLFYPATSKSDKEKPTILDLLLSLLGLSVGLYILIFYDDLFTRAGIAITRDYIFAIICIILLLEASRRTVGLVFCGLVVFFLLYAIYGYIFPGIFKHPGVSWTRTLYRMYLTYEGILGTTLSVSSTFIYLFILFSAFLEVCGTASFFNDLALALAGSKRGGPAFVAVIASALMGTLSGSAVANVATTGTFTIPLMKKVGYKPHFAGAVEAAASTGGQIMPPIMGAAAFIMASFLQISYVNIMIAAIIPALLYYLAIAANVYLEARRLNLQGVPPENLPSLKEVLIKRGFMIAPLIVIMYLLLTGRTPLMAGFGGIITTVLVSFIRKETRLTFRKLVKALEEGAYSALQVGIACAACGIIVGVAAVTGIGSIVAYSLIKLSGGIPLTALFMVMIACIILSMGLPSTALYIVVATVAAPALINLGFLPLAAHFFVFYFGALSNVTPPVALASYTAAGLANSDPTRTAITGLKLTLAGFIIPFVYTFNPVLLAQNISFIPLLISLAECIIGIAALAIGTIGYTWREIKLWERSLFILAAISLLLPLKMSSFYGIVLLSLLILKEKWKR
ncbi:MAG: TRAP transporter permease [Synergistetes bacterium]|nr:TRAP transporter permease [Synergistota bacterium]MCX8127810.1 TRAP transporter permease [Synergistota bacterium]MDW8192072.1 TRAP transporter permease [Synergistota bacterium]